jgi:hypothetical protein
MRRACWFRGHAETIFSSKLGRVNRAAAAWRMVTSNLALRLDECRATRRADLKRRAPSMQSGLGGSSVYHSRPPDRKTFRCILPCTARTAGSLCITRDGIEEDVVVYGSEFLKDIRVSGCSLPDDFVTEVCGVENFVEQHPQVNGSPSGRNAGIGFPSA